MPLPPEPRDQVRFGATVTVDGAGGVRRYQIVGVDEADAARGKIAFVSPLARALLGSAVGDTARLRAPRGEEELEIVAVEYGEPRRAKSRSTRALGITSATSGPTERTPIVPRAWPAVSSQFGWPGSRAATISFTEPSGSSFAVRWLSMIWCRV